MSFLSKQVLGFNSIFSKFGCCLHYLSANFFSYFNWSSLNLFYSAWNQPMSRVPPKFVFFYWWILFVGCSFIISCLTVIRDSLYKFLVISTICDFYGSWALFFQFRALVTHSFSIIRSISFWNSLILLYPVRYIWFDRLVQCGHNKVLDF